MRPLDQNLKRTPLVARALELELLGEALDDVRDGGAGRCLFLSGEAGVGKSRLLREFRAGLAADVTVFQGACLENQMESPYAPLVDALRRFLAAHAPAVIGDLPRPLLVELVKLLPHLSLLQPDLEPSPPLKPELEKQRLFESLWRFLVHHTESGPLLLIVEDVHWSDETSLDFLHLLARRLAAAPILLILTMRRGTPSPSLAHFLMQFNRERLGQEIALSPLSVEAVDALLRATFGWRHPLPRPLLQAIYHLTQGNPFFVEEVAGALIASGDFYHADGRWQQRPLEQLPIPHSLRLLVQQRTESVSANATELLALSAVAGQRFAFNLLAALSGLGERPLLSLLKELIAAGLLVEEGDDRFAFRHALTREAIYEGLLSRERRRWHRVVVDYYEAQNGDDDARPSQLAYHAYEAGLWERALDYGWEAGARALQQFAPHAALAHFSRAASAAGHLEQPLSPALRRQRGLAQQMVGDFEAARADFEAALAENRAAGDRRAQWRALLDLAFLWMAHDLDRMGRYLEKALTLARTLDEAALAESLNRFGNWQANRGQPRAALAHHQEALALFEGLGERRGVAATLDLIGTAYNLAGNTAAATAHYRRAIPVFRTLGDRQGLASSLTMLTVTGDRAAGEEALHIATEIGWRDGEAYAHIRLAILLTARGALGEALEHGRRALAIAREIDHRLWSGAAHLVLGMAHYYLFSLEEAARHLQEALRLAQAGGAPIWVASSALFLALIDIAEGDLDHAAHLLSDTDPLPSASETLAAHYHLLARAELALARREPEAALTAVAKLLAAVPDLHTLHKRTRLLLQSVQGRALAAQGRADEARAALAEALLLSQEESLSLFRWHCHADLARLHLRCKEWSAADEQLAAARRSIEITATSLPGEIGAHFRRAALATLPSIPELTPLQERKRAYDGLTRRERQVAALVAEGRTNAEIAEQLFITERTVKSHISNIFSKLDFTSRTQIAAWAVEKGLTD